MITPPPIEEKIDPLEDEEEREEIARRSFNRRVRIEQRALGFAASGADGLPKHRGGRFAYQLRDEQRLRNIAGVPQAIVKVIPGGGVGSRGELVAQLNYLSRDGAQELERGDGPAGYQIEGQDAIRDVATDWAMAWEDAASRDGRTARAKSKTFHLLVSYPEGTDPDMAQMAAEAFTDRLCQSGEYGDRWRYIAAWHTDRPHPHMHVVIDRLGASGRMMQIHPAKTINPKSLRALQVDTAIEYGIALNDTPRVSRGHRDRALSSPEWRVEQRGERCERSPTRQVYDKNASSFAEDAIGREAHELKKLSDRYRRADMPERRADAKALEQAAFILSSGGALDNAPQIVAKEHPEPRRHRETQERMNERAVKLENLAVAPEASNDRNARSRIDQNDRAQSELGRSLTPNRRLTELELSELFHAKEREITERQRDEVEKRELRLRNAETKDLDFQTSDTDGTNKRESIDTAGRDLNEISLRTRQSLERMVDSQTFICVIHSRPLFHEVLRCRLLPFSITFPLWMIRASIGKFCIRFRKFCCWFYAGRWPERMILLRSGIGVSRSWSS